MRQHHLLHRANTIQNEFPVGFRRGSLNASHSEILQFRSSTQFPDYESHHDLVVGSLNASLSVIFDTIPKKKKADI